jgi:hypothetical protein
VKLSDAFPSNFLKAADLQGRRVIATISHVTFEDIGKPVVYFKGKEKGLVLNKTNGNMIAEVTGDDDTDNWSGVSIVLYPTRVDFQGKRVDAIRVDKPEPGQRQAAPAPPPPPPAPFDDDENVQF